MLLSVLPGVRELRAPLAAGGLWLLTLWIWVFDKIPSDATPRATLFAEVRHIGEWGGIALVSAMLAVGSYLVGILYAPLADQIPPLIRNTLKGIYAGRRYGRAGAVIKPFLGNSEGVIDEQFNLPKLENLIASRIEQRYRSDVDFWEVCREVRDIDRAPEGTSRRYSTSGLMQTTSGRRMLLQELIHLRRHARELVDDLKILPARLVGTDNLAYERWSRLHSEANFRIYIALPLALAGFSATYRFVSPGTPIDILLTILLSASFWTYVALFLVAVGMDRQREANDQLAELVITDAASSTYLNQLDSLSIYWVSLNAATMYSKRTKSEGGVEHTTLWRMLVTRIQAYIRSR